MYWVAVLREMEKKTGPDRFFSLNYHETRQYIYDIKTGNPIWTATTMDRDLLAGTV